MVAQQNPDYTNFNLDTWDDYQSNGTTRYANQQSWLDQKTVAFNLATWQLKVITLPTGGQIQMQYEQDDYAYVQDKPARVMMPLSMSEASKENDFVLNLSETGITSPADIRATKAAIEREYTDINQADNGQRQISINQFEMVLLNGSAIPNYISVNNL